MVLAYEQVAGYIGKAKYISVRTALAGCQAGLRRADRRVPGLDCWRQVWPGGEIGRLIDRGGALSVLGRLARPAWCA